MHHRTIGARELGRISMFRTDNLEKCDGCIRDRVLDWNHRAADRVSAWLLERLQGLGRLDGGARGAPGRAPDNEAARCRRSPYIATEGVADSEIEWVAPSELETAALRLKQLVAAGHPETRRIVETYAKSADRVDPVGREFARDLADMASAVRYSFTVADSHHLLLADLTGAPKKRA